MFCSKCGAKLADDAVFCSSCGAKVVAEQEEVKLNKIEPREIKAATEEEKRQNAEMTKGVIFKRVEPGQELNSGSDAVNSASGNGAGAKKENFIKRIIGNKISDDDLDTPVWKLKPVIFTSLGLAALLVVTIVLVVGVRTTTSLNYHELGENSYYYYEEYNSDSSYVDTSKKNNSKKKKDGWEGDSYYKNGKLLKNDWAQYGDDWYYLGGDGVTIKNAYKEISGANYYFDITGKMLVNSFTPDAAHYCGPDGRISWSR